MKLFILLYVCDVKDVSIAMDVIDDHSYLSACGYIVIFLLQKDIQENHSSFGQDR